MALNETALNGMLDHIGGTITYVSLHTNAVGGGSGSEVTGGAPAYARKAMTWSAAASGTMNSAASVTFNVPAGTTIRRIGFWTAATSGTYLGDAEITPKTFAGQGTYTLTLATISLT